MSEYDFKRYNFERFGGKRNHQAYDYKEFVRTYMAAFMEGRTIGDVAETLKIEEHIAQSRLAYLRRKGVKLPLLRRRNQLYFDVDELNQIIKSAQPKSESKERT